LLRQSEFEDSTHPSEKKVEKQAQEATSIVFEQQDPTTEDTTLQTRANDLAVNRDTRLKKQRHPR
jgi:hypothetical protein